MKEQLLTRVTNDDLNVECSIAFPNANELDALIEQSKANDPSRRKTSRQYDSGRSSVLLVE